MYFNLKEFNTRFLLVLLGLLVFSPVSSVITMDVLGLPLALPELLFVPIFLLLRQRLALRSFNNSILWLLPAFFALLAISFLLHTFKPGSIISTARGYFYMILSFAIFKGRNETDLGDILLISLGSVIGWCILTVNSFFIITNSAFSLTSIAVYGNMVSLSLLISVSILGRKKKFVYISLILGILLSLTSGLRRQILIFAISLVLSLIFRFRTKIRASLKPILIVSAFIFIIIISFGKIENYIEKRAPMLYYRVFTRTEQFITGKYQASDQYRTRVIKSYFADLKTYLFPRGFVSKRTLQDSGAGQFMDFPFIELSYMLGIFLLLLLIISYFYYIYRHIRCYLLTDNYENAVWAVSGIVLIFLTFLEGTFLNYAFITPFTGLVLGKLYTIR